MLDEEGLQEIVAQIRDTHPVRKIVLFGSHARGDAHEFSDLNLCVVVSPAEELPLEPWPSAAWFQRGSQLRERLTTAHLELDPWVFSEEEFDALRERQHPFIGQILAEGRVLYEQ